MEALMNKQGYFNLEPCQRELVKTLHSYTLSNDHVLNLVTQRVYSTPDIVWSYLSDFSGPERWRSLVLHSELVHGDRHNVQVGHVRKVTYISGLPGTWDREILHTLDEEKGLLGYTVLDGDFNLNGFTTLTSLHEELCEGRLCTLIVQSYAVKPPPGQSKDSVTVLTSTIVSNDLKHLASMAESAALESDTESLLSFSSLRSSASTLYSSASF